MNLDSKMIARIIENEVLDGNAPTIDEICKILGYVRSAWAEDFQRVNNATPGYYMKMFLLRVFCLYLRNTSKKTYSVAELCTDIGRTQPFMTREFKRLFGVTPQVFRHMGDNDAAQAIDRVFKGLSFTHSFNTLPPTKKELL